MLAARGRVLPRLADVITVNEARELTRSVLAEALPRRWKHVQGVASMAERVSASLALSGDVLVSAAWLHDIGYAPDFVETGFHPLDGARYLAGLGCSRSCRERWLPGIPTRSWKPSFAGSATWWPSFPTRAGHSAMPCGTAI